MILFIILISMTSASTQLSFTKTQKWDMHLLSSANQPSHFFTKEEMAQFILDPYDPKEIQKELNLLVSLKNLRTREKVHQILSERKGLFKFGPIDPNDLNSDDPLYQFMAYLSAISGQPIMTQKMRFNRVRPSFLQKDIDPIIPIPSHPAYPSGHATQAHLFALALSECVPEWSSLFKERANEIAFNREIAGLHYPSDSQAGKILAEKIFRIIKNKEDYINHLNKAKKSWVKQKIELEHQYNKIKNI